jgi:hypothetical protein
MLQKFWYLNLTKGFQHMVVKMYIFKKITLKIFLFQTTITNWNKAKTHYGLELYTYNHMSNIFIWSFATSIYPTYKIGANSATMKNPKLNNGLHVPNNHR